MSELEDLSVVMPLAPGDSLENELIKSLGNLPLSSEIVFVSSEKREPLFSARTRWVCALKKGRAIQMNIGARKTTKKYLWFLHSDSRLEKNIFAKIAQSLAKYPDALHYFNLRFHDGPAFLMKINAIGVWFRSHLLKIPFGDQGLLISRENFEKLGGFDESAPFGEDHLFVWKARQTGILLKGVPATISTSARKYATNGWWQTTKTHLTLTLKQAVPQALLLFQKKKTKREKHQ